MFKEKMTVQRILIVSGTHGNEINPVWAVKQFNREENSLNHGIEYEYIIGNPVAYEKGCRYIDVVSPEISQLTKKQVKIFSQL